MARTDIHRPAAIVPADYDFVAVRYIGPSAPTLMSVAHERKALDAHMARTGGKYSRHEHGGSCHVCGAGALYLAIYHHPKTNSYICVGEDCADKMDLEDGGRAFATVRKAVGADREFRAGKAKAERLLIERGLIAAKEMDHDIIRDLVRKLEQYGNLSDKQWAFLTRLVEEFPLRAEKMAERAKADAASEHVGTVGERSTFTAEVLFVKANEGVYGMTYFHVLKQGDDILLYNGNKTLANKGETVTFTAAVKAHEVRDGIKKTVVTRAKKM